MFNRGGFCGTIGGDSQLVSMNKCGVFVGGFANGTFGEIFCCIFGRMRCVLVRLHHSLSYQLVYRLCLTTVNEQNGISFYITNILRVPININIRSGDEIIY